MKKAIRNIFAALAVICLSSTVAKADAYFEGGVNGARRWFTWDWNYGTNSANTGAKGVLLFTNALNSVPDHGQYEVFVHVKKNGDKYRFYCDEACTVECIGLGYALAWDTSHQVYWYGAYHDASRTGNGAFIVSNSNYSSMQSPCDLTEFLFTQTNAAANFYYNFPTFFPTLITADKFSHSPMKINICVHDTIVIDKTESHHGYYDFKEVGDRLVHAIDPGHCCAVYLNGIIQYPERISFTRSSNFTGSDSDNALISIEPDYTGGEDDPDSYYVNFTLGNSNTAVTIDNNTTNDKDVAVKVNHNGLFIQQNTTITNSVSGNHGVGVKLAAGENGCSYHNAAVELGSDVENGSGNVVINKQYIGIDAFAGVIRLKYTVGNVLNNNTVAASIERGVMLGKWAKDISSFTGNDVTISLKNPDLWASGDIVFASGRTTRSDQGLSPSQYVLNEYVCPLIQSELTHLIYVDEDDLTKVFGVTFDESGTPKNVDYEFPVFRLNVPSIYNTRTLRWYSDLYTALNDSGYPVADGDQIVYFGNVIEPSGVTITNNITIRSASTGNNSDVSVAAAADKTILPGGFTSTYNGSASSFITVSEGKTLTLGGNAQSGMLTLNLDGKGRALNISGTATVNDDITITNGYAGSDGGGAVYVQNGGTFNLDGGTISGNSTTGNGAGVYQGGTMNVSGNPVFGSVDEVYLCADHFMTKAGAIGPGVSIPVRLADESSGRDILVSSENASSSASGMVNSSDNGILNVLLPDGSPYTVIYNSNGFDGSYLPKDVIELFLGNGKIIIEKEGLKAGDSATFTVCVTGSSVPVYTVVLTGVDDLGSKVSVKILDIPLNTYTVAESDWSWAYTGSEAQSKNILASKEDSVFVTFSFSNSPVSNVTEHAEANANNVFGSN